MVNHYRLCADPCAIGHCHCVSLCVIVLLMKDSCATHTTLVSPVSGMSSFARPEILYGRPALAALRMQRDTLHQLYRTYDTRARTREGTSGISRRLFLEVSIKPARIMQYSIAKNNAMRCLPTEVSFIHTMAYRVLMLGFPHPLPRSSRCCPT